MNRILVFLLFTFIFYFSMLKKTFSIAPRKYLFRLWRELEWMIHRRWTFLIQRRDWEKNWHGKRTNQNQRNTKLKNNIHPNLTKLTIRKLLWLEMASPPKIRLPESSPHSPPTPHEGSYTETFESRSRSDDEGQRRNGGKSGRTKSGIATGMDLILNH